MRCRPQDTCSSTQFWLGAFHFAGRDRMATYYSEETGRVSSSGRPRSSLQHKGHATCTRKSPLSVCAIYSHVFCRYPSLLAVTCTAIVARLMQKMWRFCVFLILVPKVYFTRQEPHVAGCFPTSQGFCICLPKYYTTSAASTPPPVDGPKFSFPVQMAPANQSDKIMV